jgi:hypothetical protein
MCMDVDINGDVDSPIDPLELRCGWGMAPSNARGFVPTLSCLEFEWLTTKQSG